MSTALKYIICQIIALQVLQKAPTTQNWQRSRGQRIELAAAKHRGLNYAKRNSLTGKLAIVTKTYNWDINMFISAVKLDI